MQQRVRKLEPAVLGGARAGGHAAFRELVHPFDPGLRSLAFGLLGDTGRMEDVLQEAYVKAYRSLGAYRGDASVRTWIYRITVNACVDDIRRRSHLAALPMDTVMDRPATSPDSGDRDVPRSGVAAALGALPADQRAAVLLVDAEGFDYGAAAKVLGVAEETVASRVSRARVTLREALRDSGEEER